MNLRTVLHLLRTDVRRMRLLISVTLALLTLNFALTLSANEWRAPAQRSSSMDNSWSLYGNSLRNVTEGSMLGAGVFAACLAGAAGWQGLAWSRTRPVRRREAAAAKVALLGGFLIGPQIIMVFTVLLRHGIPLREALLGTAAAAGVFVPLWIMLAALGRLAGSGAAFLAGLVFIGAGAGIAGLFDERMIQNFWIPLGDPWGQYAGPHSWYFIGTCAAGLLLLIPFIVRRWKTPARLVAAACVVVGSGYGWRFTDWFRIGDGYFDIPGVSRAVLDNVTPVPPVTRFDASESNEKGKRAISLSGSFGTDGLPPGVFAWWQPSGEALLRSDGKVIAAAQSRFVIAGRPQLQALFPPRRTPMDQASVMAALPEEARLVQERESPIVFSFQKSPADLGSFTTTEPGISLSGRAVSLEADLTAILYRYELLVNTPLDKPVSMQRGAMLVHVRRAATEQAPEVADARADVAVQFPTLGVSDDALTTSWLIPPSQAWRVFLYTPADGQVREGNSIFSSSAPLLGGGGIHRNVYAFTGEWGDQRPVHIEGARIVILEPRLLGLTTRRVVTPPAPLKFNDPGANDYYAMLSQPRSPAKAEVPPPVGDPRRPDPETASRREFGAWLRQIQYNPFNGWLEDELVRWVPYQLDTILNIRPYSSDYEYEWCKALSRVMPESRREVLFRKLPDAPWLSWVIHRRGWEREAKPELLSLFNSGHDLNLACLLSVASLEEPATYDRLLGFLASGGQIDLYEALRRLPGIEPRLTETVRRYFAGVTVHGKTPAEDPGYNSMQQSRLRVPLRHGLPEALRDALVIFRWEIAVRNGSHSPQNDYQSEALMEFIVVPSHLKPRGKEACDFLAALKPDDCRFDPLTRRWLTPGVIP